jgi:hypothetical protein
MLLSVFALFILKNMTQINIFYLFTFVTFLVKFSQDDGCELRQLATPLIVLFVSHASFVDRVKQKSFDGECESTLCYAHERLFPCRGGFFRPSSLPAPL